MFYICECFYLLQMLYFVERPVPASLQSSRFAGNSEGSPLTQTRVKRSECSRKAAITGAVSAGLGGLAAAASFIPAAGPIVSAIFTVASAGAGVASGLMVAYC